MGRPPKPASEKFIKRMITVPPDLWARLEAAVPERERSAFIQGEIERGLRRLGRQKPPAGEERDGTQGD